MKIWLHNVVTGIPSSEEAVEIDTARQYAKTRSGGFICQYWGGWYASQEAAFEGGKKKIIARLREDKAYAQKMKKVGIQA